MTVNKSWNDLKAILTANSLYFDYEDNEDKTIRHIICARNALVNYLCEMRLALEPESPQDDSWKTEDQKDFDDNWASQSGEKTYCYWTENHSFAANSTSKYVFQLKDYCHTGETVVDAFLFKGFISVDTNAVRGDTIRVAVVDHDNLLGYGIDFVLGYFIRKAIVEGGAQIMQFVPPSIDFFTNRKRLLKTFWIMVEMTTASLSQVNANLGIEYEY